MKKMKWLIISIAVIGVLFASEWYIFERDLVYKCKNLKTGLPVFIKFTRSGIDKGGYIGVDVHHPDGNVYVHGAVDDNYTILSDRLFGTMTTVLGRTFISLDLDTGSFSVTVESPKYEPLAISGVCEI